MRKGMTAAALLLVTGCGGGGGGGGSGAVQLPANNNPTFSGGSFSISENVAAVPLSASDPDGDPLTFTVSGGADGALFTTSGSQLQFRSAPNFEAPADANGDNVYQLTVSVSDGKSSVSASVSVTVQNDPEGVQVRRIASTAERWMGGSLLDNGSVLLLTAHTVQRFDLGAETRSQHPL